MSITSSQIMIRKKIVELMGGPVLRVVFEHPLYAVLNCWREEDGPEDKTIFQFVDESVVPDEYWWIREFEYLGVRFLSMDFSDYGGSSDPWFYYKVGSLPKGFHTRVAMLEAERVKRTGLTRYGFPPKDLIK